MKKLDQTVKKVSNGARVLDATLCVGLLVASFWFEQYSNWWWFLVASSALSAVTAMTAPLEKLNTFLVTKFLKSKSAR